MSTLTAARPVAAPVPRASSTPGGWLVNPWFDALLVANIAWPLLLLAQVGQGFAGHAGLQFWQVYYITTPHRWVTLALVFLDRERFAERRGLFLGLAAFFVVLCIGVRWTTGTLTCLLAVDYAWNAWHFAAQHHGIYRIYGRMSEPVRNSGLTAEKWAMRLFILYVILRIATATWSDSRLERMFQAADWLTIAVPAWLVAADLLRGGVRLNGRRVYLFSVSTLYLTLLWAIHARRPALVLSLAMASAIFHALEYLALVSWLVGRRRQAAGERVDILGYLAPRWAIALSIFVVVLGAGGWLLDQHWMKWWLLVNVIVAFLHYTYDGLIWRTRRRPAPAGAPA